MTRWFLPILSLLWGFVSIGAITSDQSYLSNLSDTIRKLRPNLPGLSESAEQAALQFVAGGNLWVAGRQPDWIGEACGRAGGLMAIGPLGNRSPVKHDIILDAVPGRFEETDSTFIDNWQKQGATVVKFASSAGLFHGKFPLDTLANTVELWTWTGEFIAACTRLGKMPIVYESYGLPGGIARGKKYQGQKFHSDLTIAPIGHGVLGGAYLGQIESMLLKLQTTQWPKLIQAADQWSKVPPSAATSLVIGHLFPQHLQDARTHAMCDFITVPTTDETNLLAMAHGSKFILYLGYQTAPQKLVQQARGVELNLVYTSVQPARPPEPSNNILYIDPGWPLADGCVAVAGYDIPILPASGILQAAIFWTIASQKPGQE